MVSNTFPELYFEPNVFPSCFSNAILYKPSIPVFTDTSGVSVFAMGKTISLKQRAQPVTCVQARNRVTLLHGDWALLAKLSPGSYEMFTVRSQPLKQPWTRLQTSGKLGCPNPLEENVPIVPTTLFQWVPPLEPVWEFWRHESLLLS